MNITIAAVGKVKSRPEGLLLNEYRKRIKWPLQLKEVEERKSLGRSEMITREATLLSNALPPGALVVALDRTGQCASSNSFAQLFETWMNSNQKEVAFILGGPDGLEKNLLASANIILSMGAQTWPHFLARCMLLEQVYRAQCIIQNHPYHR